MKANPQLQMSSSSMVSPDIARGHGRETVLLLHGQKNCWAQNLSKQEYLPLDTDSSVVDLRSMVSKNRIGNHSTNLLAAVATYRENDDTNNRPIIFVARSLGGLICQDVSH